MRYLTICTILLCLLASGRGAEQNPAEAKLREGLRNTMLQLRTVQAERDTLQAEKAQLEQEKQALVAQVESLTKKAAAEQEEASQKIVAIETRNNRQAEELARLGESLNRWKASQQEAAALAAANEAKWSKSNQLAIELQRRVDDQQAKNLAMYRIGTEILQRYESFGLGTAITAREPFTGAMRVRLQNQVQDFQDKLQEQRLHAEPAKASTPTTPARAKAEEKPARKKG